jgi:glycosyltransferase involved in cell wall biosynthesis
MSNLICAICATYNRPELLGRAIACFENQTYENRHLIIVDDLGQYEYQKGDRWELISFPRKIITLGEKRNVCSALASRETWAYARWDDDDLYMPWHLEAMAEALTRGPFVQPRYAVDFWDGKWVVMETFSSKVRGGRSRVNRPNKSRRWDRDKHQVYCYGGQWGYTRELFWRVGGYGPDYVDEDMIFQRKMFAHNIKSVGFSEKYQPSYFYNRPFTDRASENWRGIGMEEAYWSEVKAPYIGKVPEWTDDSIFEQEIPSEIMTRRF